MLLLTLVPEKYKFSPSSAFTGELKLEGKRAKDFYDENRDLLEEEAISIGGFNVWFDYDENELKFLKSKRRK